MTGETVGHILWAIALLILVVSYSDTLARTVPRRGMRYVRSASGRRLLLGICEAGIIGAALFLHSNARTRLPLGSDSIEWVGPFGGLIALVAALLAAWAKITLGRHFTGNLGIKEEHVLIQAGPYARIRHPIYGGIVLFAAGSGFVWNDAIFLLAAGALLICFAVQSHIEDRLLAAHFGSEFEEYRARVPGIVPWGRFRRSTSWARIQSVARCIWNGVYRRTGGRV